MRAWRGRERVCHHDCSFEGCCSLVGRAGLVSPLMLTIGEVGVVRIAIMDV